MKFIANLQLIARTTIEIDSRCRNILSIRTAPIVEYLVFGIRSVYSCYYFNFCTHGQTSRTIYHRKALYEGLAKRSDMWFILDLESVSNRYYFYECPAQYFKVKYRRFAFNESRHVKHCDLFSELMSGYRLRWWYLIRWWWRWRRCTYLQINIYVFLFVLSWVIVSIHMFLFIYFIYLFCTIIIIGRTYN